MPKFLYRIEHRTDKIGFYNQIVCSKVDGFTYYFASLVRNCLDMGFSESYHLSPYANGLGKYHGESSRYGFCSLNKLRKWFGTDRKFYEFCYEYDMIVRRYKATNRFDSDRQSIAMLEELNDFAEISIDQILKTK